MFDVSKTYYYSVIESLCRLIKSIQQGQRTALVSLAKIVQDQRDEIEKYQNLIKLPEEVKQLQLGMEKLKKHVNTQLESVTSTVFESKDDPTQMTKQSFTILYFITYRKLYTLNTYAKMFTVEDSIFPNTWIQFSNPELN